MDPMRYVPRTGDYIMQGANQMASAIRSIPQALMQDEQYKRAEAAYQNERDLMTDAYSGTNSLLQNLGVNKTVRAPREGEGKEQYLEYIVGEIAPLVRDENGGVSNEKLSMVKERIGQIGLGGNQQMQSSLQTRNLLQQYGPMGQQLQEQPQSQPQGDFAGQGTIMNPETPSTQMPSATEAPPVQNDPLAFDPMASLTNRRKTYYDLLRAGNISNQTFMEKMTDLDGKEFDIKKAELDLEKARIMANKNAAAGNIVGNVGKGPIYKDNERQSSISPLDVYNNPDDYSLDTVNYPKEFAPRGGGRGGSGSGDKEPESKLRVEKDKLANDLKSVTQDGYPMDGAEPIYNRTIKEMRIIDAALNLQEKEGGPAILPDSEAKRVAREIISTHDVLMDILMANQKEQDGVTMNVINETEQMESGEYVNNGTKKLLNMNIGRLKQLEPSSYNKIIQAVNEGYTLGEIVSQLKSKLNY